MSADSYLTITEATQEVLHKDRGSKFYGHVFPLNDEQDVPGLIAPLRNKYPKAGHHCYAWKLGAGEDHYRSNDDGEPNHSAGDPILSQVNAYEVSDVLVVVSRIFGGTKLGVGGLIQAYREAARLSLESARLMRRLITSEVQIDFEYAQMSQVMRFIDANNYTIKQQELTHTCRMIIAVPQSQQEEVVEEVNKMYPITGVAVD
ncbi:IMPACT family protein [Nonlabens ponticola]|uniref:DUF1949 domain-containing protein n=1 Tax=Nonlabens ponticola TaxID=2496866 RepID=A0A3S9MXY8_9FLAO|nr:YigZ family protein [Nonlabens ponticola]AZQ44007.1 DUF1949 domain-containing protein [Nonlabens ponticola]